MKKTKIFISLIMVIIFIIVLLKNIDFGIKNIKNNDVNISIPRFSIIFKKEENSISFLTFKSVSLINEGYTKKFSTRLCNYNQNYYDKKNNITIKELNVKKGFVLNSINIKYEKGESDAEKCNKVTDPTRIMYYVQKLHDYDEKELLQYYKYLDKDGKKYDIYHIKGFELWIRDGRGDYEFYHSHLFSGYLSMQDIFDFLEYQVKRDQGTKEVLRDGEVVIYRIDNLSLIKCNTKQGNKDVYLGDEKLLYKDNFCSI